MPTLEWNVSQWDTSYEWPEQGDEWSGAWGTVDMHWYATLLPRLHAFVPARHILEIAPGRGRWTAYLARYCETLTGVDISPTCVEHCRERFKSDPRLSFHSNDGASLPMGDDGSVDLVFSFDSLVHVELAVLSSYLAEISRVLTPQGVAFLHHSNLGQYPRYFSLIKRLKSRFLTQPDTAPVNTRHAGEESQAPAPPRPGLARKVIRAGRKIGIDSDHSRAGSVTAEAFADAAAKVGLKCVSQEIVNWGTLRTIDCISVVARADSDWPDNGRVVNPNFMDEAERTKALSDTYSDKRLRSRH